MSIESIFVFFRSINIRQVMSLYLALLEKSVPGPHWVASTLLVISAIFCVALCIVLVFLLIRGLAKGAIVAFSPVLQTIRRELEEPSHLLYLGLFAYGAVGSANVAIGYFDLNKAGFMSSGPAQGFLTVALLAFFSTNVLHHYLIYKLFRGVEIKGSPQHLRYDGWWVGSFWERSLRIVVLALLLGVAGEIYHFHGPELGEVRGIAILNCCLFFLYFCWNGVALRRSKERAAELPSDEDRRQVHTDVLWAQVLTIAAFLLWLMVSAALDFPLLINLVILFAYSYTFLLIVTRLNRKTWHQSYLIFVSLLLFYWLHPDLFAVINK